MAETEREKSRMRSVPQTQGLGSGLSCPEAFQGGREVLFSLDKADTRCEGILLEFLLFASITSPISIFTAFLFSAPHILECKCQGYSNYLFPFVSKNFKSRNCIFGYPGLGSPTPSSSLILLPPLPWVKPQQVLAGLSPRELPEIERMLPQFCLQIQTVHCLILRMAPKPF